MGNNKGILRYSHFATLFLVALAIASAVWIYLSLTSTPNTTISEETEKVEVNQDLYNQIRSDLSFGTEVSPDEPGFGRVNPFANYKAETVETEESSAETEAEQE